MNIILQINNLLQEYKSGNKLKVYKKLNQILKKRKDDNLLRFNIAVIEQELNLNKEARKNYKFILINEKNIKAMVNLYNLDIKEEKFNNAYKILNQILEINTNLDFVYRDKAFVCLKINKIEDSINICKILLKKNNRDLDVLNVLGLCALAQNKKNDAKKIFNKILSYNENNLSALNSLGRINHEDRNSKEAEKFFLRALKVDKSSYQVLNNVAGFYREEGKYEKGIKFYLKALEINPNNYNILNNLSKSYFDINNFELAKSYALRALKLNENDGDIKKILAFIYLRNQDYDIGWSYFEGRLKTSDFQEKNDSLNKIQKKLFIGKNLNKNKKILIMREQGVGDEILYGSIYSDVLENIENVKIECDPRLLGLFKNSFSKYKDNFVELGSISNDQKKIDTFDNVLYAGSLGKFFRKKIKDFKNKPYLIANENRIKEFKSYLKKFDKKINIGLSWKSFKNRYSSEKSLSLYNFKNIFKLRGCNFFNLQYGDVTEEVTEFTNKNNFEIITNKELDLYNDFESLAGLLKNIDVFLTVSNSTAHLAGSLGVRTILIKPSNHALFHYWNQPTNKTPWYNSIEVVDRDFLNNNELINNIINL